MTKEYAPHVKAKPCDHGITPWTECAECVKGARYNWHFTHNGQWTLRRQELIDKRADEPFGNIGED